MKKKYVAMGLSLLLSIGGLAVGAFSGKCEREEMKDAMEEKWKELTTVKPEPENQSEE